MDSLVAHPLAGTDNANVVFWAPDSRRLAFGDGSKLRKIDTTGGPPFELADMPNNNGGAWSVGDVILFRGNAPVLSAINAAGGKVTPVTTLDQQGGTGAHWQPNFLPDGKHFLYHATSGTGAVVLGSLDANEKPRVLIPSGSNAQYASGHALFMRGTTLMAQPFNLDSLQLEGEPRPLVEQVVIGGDTGRTGAFSVSTNGVLVYQTGASGSDMRVMWVDREGKTTDTINQTGDNRAPRFSPDEKRVAVDRRSENGVDIWVLDLVRGTNTRVTFGEATETTALWTPDGTRLLYRANPQGKFSIYSKPANGTGEEELVLGSDHSVAAFNDLSADGNYLLFTSDSDIWFAALSGDKTPQRLMKTPFSETGARFSTDGKWVVYVSNETNPVQVYVVPFPPGASGERIQISVGGGANPRWRRDGKELFFLAGNRMFSVDFKISGGTIDAGTPKQLFALPPGTAGSYAVTAGGDRFLVSAPPLSPVQSNVPATEPPIVAVVNWTALP